MVAHCSASTASTRQTVCALWIDIGAAWTDVWFAQFCVIIIMFYALGINDPEGLKITRKNVSEWLGVGVKICLLREASMDADAVKALDGYGKPLKEKCPLSRVASVK